MAIKLELLPKRNIIEASCTEWEETLNRQLIEEVTFLFNLVHHCHAKQVPDELITKVTDLMKMAEVWKMTLEEEK